MSEVRIYGRTARKGQFLIEHGDLHISDAGTDYILFPQDERNMVEPGVDQSYLVKFNGYLVITLSGSKDFYLMVDRKLRKVEFDETGFPTSDIQWISMGDLANNGEPLKGGRIYEFILRVGAKLTGRVILQQYIAFTVRSDYSDVTINYSVFGVEV